MKAVRGATVAMADTEEAVIEATRELIEEIISKNSLIQDNIISIFFYICFCSNKFRNDLIWKK